MSAGEAARLSEGAGEAARSPEAPADVLRARAERLAQPLAATIEAQADTQVLCFRLGVERYAIETHYVTQTRRATPVTPLPHAAPYVLGLANVNGDLLVVFDLRALLGVERVANGGTHFVILGKEQPELAIEVDALDSVDPLATDTLLDPTTAVAASNGGSRPWLRGVTKDALLVLDGSVLLEDERLYVDST